MVYFFHSVKKLSFVPKHEPLRNIDIDKLEKFVTSYPKLLILTGAGISTESGIPDYRSEGVGVYSRKRKVPFKPVLQDEFVKFKSVRQRYWLKNYVGWPIFSVRPPNVAHFSLTKLEDVGKISYIITQNVDNLHSKALSKNVVELHGSAYRIKCLNCNFKIRRKDFQKLLEKYNSNVNVEVFTMNPDGDVDIDEDLFDNFKVPECPDCEGILQPDIVFFGGNVPRERTDFVRQLVDDCDSLLVLGSTLTVFSSFRIVLQAFESNKPIAIINIGQTRGDKCANLKINARCGEILPVVCDRIIKK